MPNLIYRVVSVCGALGYGFPEESLQAALEGRIDAIIADGGSIDAGPFYLGTGAGYFEREAVKTDYRRMVAAGMRLGCPVILGSSGMAGGDRNLDQMIDVAKEVFSDLNIRDVKVAVIPAGLEPDIVVQEYRAARLRAIGAGLELSEEALRSSVIVGQMGVHPIMTALDGGAQLILAGRSCDAALFASDMIRRGIDPGLAYHIGHVLECGALACDPGSPSDCLVAEVYDDGSAMFTAPNPGRRCTAYSIAAHSLYEESHPQIQHYPEGMLVMDSTQFFSRDARSAGIRNSQFFQSTAPGGCSIKLEGSRLVGKRKVSLIHIDPADLDQVPDDILVYGRNGVQVTPVETGQSELGVIIETRASTEEAAVLLASLLARHFIHCAYPGRKSTSGNLAVPMSPNLVSFVRADGLHGAIVPGGTRDPAFIANYARIRAAVIGRVEAEFPDAVASAAYSIIEADATAPVMLLRTVDADAERLAERHAHEVSRMVHRVKPKPGSHINLDAPDAYEWTLYHLLQNDIVIRNVLFPITYYRANGATWSSEGTERPRYGVFGDLGYSGDVDDRTLSLINDASPAGMQIGKQALRDMVTVIRSKDAGINRLTFDIVFSSSENYEAALCSNLFSGASIASILGISPERVVGTFFVDSCNAIKITIDRPNISASLDERDVFGAQQQARLERMSIPVYAAALSEVSAF